MKAIVANNLNGTKATISFSDGIPGMAPKKVIIALATINSISRTWE
jgi:hypothetical protein